MSVTNTTIFNLTRNEIMDASARVTGYLGAGETLSVEDQTNRSQALNIMVKSWADIVGKDSWNEVNLQGCCYPKSKTAGMSTVSVLLVAVAT